MMAEETKVEEPTTSAIEKKLRSIRIDPLPIAYIDIESTDDAFHFPPYCKVIAWIIVALVVAVSSTFLIIFGLHFGTIRCFLWISTILLCVLITASVLEPLRIFIFAFIQAYCKRESCVVSRRHIAGGHLINAYDRIKKRQMLNYRIRHSALYAPLPYRKLHSRLIDIKYDLEMRNLVGDIILYSTLLITTLFIVFVERTSESYHIHYMVEEVYLNGSYSRTIKFGDVSSYDE